MVLLLSLVPLGRCQVLEESHGESEEEKCLEEGEEEFNSEVHVATLQFEEVQIQVLAKRREGGRERGGEGRWRYITLFDCLFLYSYMCI